MKTYCNTDLHLYRVFAVVLCAVLFFSETGLALNAEELQAAPELKDYEVTVSEGTITEKRTYYHVTVINPGQEYLIACGNHVLGSDEIYWNTETRNTGSGSSISLKRGSYSLRCSEAGLCLESASPSSRSGGSWAYENSHLVYTVRSREGSAKYYLTYTQSEGQSGNDAERQPAPESAEAQSETPAEVRKESEDASAEDAADSPAEDSDPSSKKETKEEPSGKEEKEPAESRQGAGEAEPDGAKPEADAAAESKTETQSGEPAGNETAAGVMPHGLARIAPAVPFTLSGALEEPVNNEVRSETSRFGCSQNESDAAEISLYTYGELNPCDVRMSADFDYHILGDEVSVALPSVTYRSDLDHTKAVWNIWNDGNDYDSPEAVQTALSAITQPGVYPVTVTVSGVLKNSGDIIYCCETSSPQNYIAASGILENSVFTFSDVHMEFPAIGNAVRDIMAISGGKIPSLVVCTGDWANGRGITYEYTKNTILPLIDAQLCGIDTVYVAGNHESGKAASEATIERNIGADASFEKGYGVIFRSSSEGAIANGRTSRHAADLAVYGINYDAMYDSAGHPSYTNIISDVKAFLEDAARRSPDTLVLISAHAGTHVISDWAGGANYNIDDSFLLVEAINEMARTYNLDVMFLFGHDHSRNEKEFILQRGQTITSPVYYRSKDDKQAKDEILCYSYAHAGYLTSSIGGNQHYSLITWDENAITHHLEQIGVGVDTDTTIDRLSKDPQYIVDFGQESSWTKGSGVNARFEIHRTGYELAYELFESASVDGKALTEEFFETSKGSLILDLKSGYLETLNAGKHVLHVAFKDTRSTDITFYVKAAAPSPEPPAPSSASPAPSSVVPHAVPNTADPFRRGLWACLLAGGITAAALSIYLLERYR